MSPDRPAAFKNARALNAAAVTELAGAVPAPSGLGVQTALSQLITFTFLPECVTVVRESLADWRVDWRVDSGQGVSDGVSRVGGEGSRTGGDFLYGRIQDLEEICAEEQQTEGTQRLEND